MEHSQFFVVAIAHLLAVMSPGPDFAVVAKQSLVSGRSAALRTSIGLALGVAVHISYSILGIGLIISQSILLFRLIQYLGAAYLIFIGIKAFTSNNASEDRLLLNKKRDIEHNAIALGFLTNVLNPKATIFFLSLFSIVISPNTPHLAQVAYGAWMVVATFLWFALVSFFLSHGRVRDIFMSFGNCIDRVLGAALITLGIKLALVEFEQK